MKFEDFSLSKETLKSISIMGYEEPTPIQVSAIPMVMGGADLVGQARQEQRKTAAFGIPIVELHRKGKNPFAIILEPTRELAVQVAQEMIKIGAKKKYRRTTGLRRHVHRYPDKGLEKRCGCCCGYPGRVIDHIKRKTLLLSDIKIVVLDEADEMLDMGFIEDIESILKTTPPERQTLLFSATMPQPIMNIAKRYMRNPEKIRINTKDLVVHKSNRFSMRCGTRTR